MAGVDLKISETITTDFASATQIADSLSGGGTGTSLDQVTNGSFSPVILKSGNTGRQNWFIRGNNTVDPVTDMKIHIQEFGVGTGFTYGGPASRSAAADFTTIKAEGTASGSSKNNNDLLSSGIWMEMNVLEMITATNQFDQASRPADVKIFGDSGTDGQDLASAITLVSEAACIDTDQGNGGDGTDGYIPNAPVDGSIGIDNDIALGDQMHIGLRAYLRSSFTDGGIFQVEIVIVYTFTA